jgi:hypothetical protein
MNLTTIILLGGCLLVGGLVLGLIAMAILSGRHGEGVSNARRSWIEDIEDQDNGSKG